MKHRHASTATCNYNCSIRPTSDRACHGSKSSEAGAGQGSLVTPSGI